MTGKREKVIKPGSVIGILGGGQLGRMMALAGREMGYSFISLDPVSEAPVKGVSELLIQGDFSDPVAALKLAKSSDVVTYEFENVDAKVARILEEESYVPQGSRLLRITQNRILEKTTIESFGIQVAPFRVIQSEDELAKAALELGLPAVLKTTQGGYDGKGQFVLRKQSQVAEAYASLSGAGVELILEKFIDFVQEVSVIVARNVAGEASTFPMAENVHVENILHLSIVPARTSSSLQAKAEELALHIAESLQLVGLLAVEMFVTASGEIYVNELAPRPHNSGHYTQDACATSQFEQHIRAICNLPLGNTKLLTPVVMVNILGEHLEKVLHQIEYFPPEVKLHLYGKIEAKSKRKMGHLNVQGDSVDQCLTLIQNLGIWEI